MYVRPRRSSARVHTLHRRRWFGPPLTHTTLDTEMQSLDDESLTLQSEAEIILPRTACAESEEGRVLVRWR